VESCALASFRRWTRFMRPPFALASTHACVSIDNPCSNTSWFSQLRSEVTERGPARRLFIDNLTGIYVNVFRARI
jgi:hypothetical protein